MKIYYQHFRTGLKRITTVAYTINGNNVQYTIAECSNKDQFCKKIGRDIASGRLLKGHEVDAISIKDITSHAYIGKQLFDVLQSTTT